MKLLLVLCLFLVGCTVDATFDKPRQNQQPQILDTDVVKIQLPVIKTPSRYLQNDIAVVEYQRGKYTYLIFKCGDQIFVQKVEDTTNGK